MVVSAKMAHQNRARWVFAVAAVQQNVGHVNDAMWTYLYTALSAPRCERLQNSKKRRSAKAQSDKVTREVGVGERQALRRRWDLDVSSCVIHNQ